MPAVSVWRRLLHASAAAPRSSEEFERASEPASVGGAAEFRSGPPSDPSLAAKQHGSSSVHISAGPVLRAARHAEGASTVRAAVAAKPALLAHRPLNDETLWHVVCQSGQLSLLQDFVRVLEGHADEVRAALVGGVRVWLGGQRQRRLRELSNIDALLSTLLNYTNFAGMTPLHMAACAGHADVVEFLLRMGGNPWALDCRGNRTALHCAALSGHAECVAVLLRHVEARPVPEHVVQSHGLGVKYIDLRTFSGLSALHYAIGCHHTDAALELMRHAPNNSAANLWDIPDPFVNVPQRTSCLHLAAMTANVPIALEILREFARRAGHIPDPRLARDGKGRLPYQEAVAINHVLLARLLMPGQDLGRLFAALGEELPVGHVPSLATLATAALERKLEGDLDAIGTAKQQQQQQQLAARQDVAAAAGTTAAVVAIASSGRAGSGALLQRAGSDNICDLCMDCISDVATGGCGHRMCSGCARKLCKAVHGHAPPCPFCRAPIGSFKPC